jgi:hypothetical protein
MQERENQVIRFLNAFTEVSLENFEDRLRLQKLIYLAREIGFECGFAFSWYVHGPYSPSLTRVLFTADEMGELSLDDAKLTKREESIVSNLKQLLGDKINDARQLELFASVWYVLPEGDLSSGSKSQIIGFLKKEKPRFQRAEFEDAIKKIQKFRSKLKGRDG